MDCKGLRETSDNTFAKRSSLLSLWQELAWNFYPERADFTINRHVGSEFAENLSTSYPILVRRELAGAFPTMLRPKQMEWFETVLAHGRPVDHDGRAWLQWAAGVQRRAMYDIKSRYARAVVEGDNDYATFGQDVMSIRLNDVRDTLMYRCWHLRDVAWLEDEDGNVCPIFRKWKPQARYLTKKFPDTASDKLKRTAQKQPFEEIDCLHMIVPMELYEDDFTVKRMEGARRTMPYVSIYYDCRHDTKLEAIPTWNKEYCVERWQTVSGSQYAYSPATVAALPDARLLQAMTYTLLEAAEKATNPPLVATEGAVRSDMATYAGGVTWVDIEYDERLGDALRPLTTDKNGIPIGIEIQRDTRAMLRECFFLNKLKPFVPTEDPQMTAFQAGQIVAQYIRDALPIFEPMESERNGQVCEITFDLLLRGGAFGSPFDMPRSLRDAEVTFQFQNPLHEAIEAQKGHKFLEMKQLIEAAVSMDQNAAAVPNVIDALRDALIGIRAPAPWVHSEVQVKQMQEQAQQKQQAAELLASLQAGADAAKTTGEAMNQMALAEAA